MTKYILVWEPKWKIHFTLKINIVFKMNENILNFKKQKTNNRNKSAKNWRVCCQDGLLRSRAPLAPRSPLREGQSSWASAFLPSQVDRGNEFGISNSSLFPEACYLLGPISLQNQERQQSFLLVQRRDLRTRHRNAPQSMLISVPELGKIHQKGSDLQQLWTVWRCFDYRKCRSFIFTTVVRQI